MDDALDNLQECLGRGRAIILTCDAKPYQHHRGRARDEPACDGDVAEAKGPDTLSSAGEGG
jgi:hypothetical protein